MSTERRFVDTDADHVASSLAQPPRLEGAPDGGPLSDPHAQLAPSTRELEDIRYALDQSAIVATTDVKGRIKNVNDKFCEISKYSRAELLGQDHRLLNASLHSKEFIRDLWRTLARGRVWRGELRNRAKDGSHCWVDTTIVPFLDTHGKPWQYMAICYDITQRKEQEARLREQSALARLGEMAAVVSHEVRNPLAGVHGALQVITTRFTAGSTEAKVIGEIIARIDALSGTLDELLLFARPREPKRASVAVSPFLMDVAAWLKRDPAMSDVHVELALTAAVAFADADQLRIVFTNLLLNAAQAMDYRGLIRIDTRREEGRCVILVQDTGPGMSAETRARAFEPFFTTKHRGTGIGLSIVKRIIDAHAGTIEMTCPPAGGTLIRLSLPCTPPPLAPTSSPPS